MTGKAARGLLIDTKAERGQAGFQPTGLSPATVFAQGVDGFWGDSTDSATLFQDSAGVTPADAGDPCGQRADKSGNGNDQYQTTTAAKPTVQVVNGVQALVLDGTDDSMLIDVPAGGWAGTFVQGTALGVIVGEIDVPAGPYQIPTNPNYAGPGSDIHTVIVNRTLAAHELDGLVGWVGQRCAVRDFAGVAGMSRWFFQRDDLTGIDVSRYAAQPTDLFQAFAEMGELQKLNLSGLGTSSTGSMYRMCQNNVKMVELDLSNNSTQALNTAFQMAIGCVALTTVKVYGGTGSPFADSPCIEYSGAFANTNLTQQSYTDIVTAIESAGTSNGTLDITGGSATTTGAAQTAVDALRARGWTVTTPDGY